ncbi:hypothetical protein CsSME_00037959 [Camellia sinensis var. sinensis]
MDTHPIYQTNPSLCLSRTASRRRRRRSLCRRRPLSLSLSLSLALALALALALSFSLALAILLLLSRSHSYSLSLSLSPLSMSNTCGKLTLLGYSQTHQNFLGVCIVWKYILRTLGGNLEVAVSGTLRNQMTICSIQPLLFSF